jgi:hypothetical protein
MFLFLIPGRSAAAAKTCRPGRTELNRYQFSARFHGGYQRSLFANLAIQDEVAMTDARCCPRR